MEIKKMLKKEKVKLMKIVMKKNLNHKKRNIINFLYKIF